jgi:signal recognition particle subunit SRP54
MLPGMGQMKEQLAQVDDRDIDRVMAIIRSMTPQERRDPKILQASRKARVARGSGVTVTEVNQLLDRFDQARKMIKQMAGGGMLPGMRRAGKAAARKGNKKANKSRKGNPAARAAEAKAAAAARAARKDGAPTGLPGGDADLSQLGDLSKLDLSKLGGLGKNMPPGSPYGPPPGRRG